MAMKPYIPQRPDCQWWQAEKCTLGLYGGTPQAIACLLCISNLENNQEFANRLFESRERSHPPGARRVSGCCDSALNPPPV